MPRAYNALSGDELRKTILAEVDRAITNAGIEGVGITFPNAMWHWSLTLSTHQMQIEQREAQAGVTEELVIKDSKRKDRELTQLEDGSERFSTNPPSPTEIRRAEGLPIPEG